MSEAHPNRQALPTEQTVVLCCIRTWVKGLHHAVPTAASIAAMMARLGANEAAACLEAFMTALGNGATRRIAIDRVEQPRVGPDERVLLGILTYAQESRPSEALLLLQGLVIRQAARPVLRSAEGLATELALAGRFLLSTDIALPGHRLPAPRLGSHATLH